MLWKVSPFRMQMLLPVLFQPPQNELGGFFNDAMM
jgi:hypothetical protein